MMLGGRLSFAVVGVMSASRFGRSRRGRKSRTESVGAAARNSFFDWDEVRKRMNSRRADLIKAIGNAVQSFQDATDTFDDAACAMLGLSRTDLK